MSSKDPEKIVMATAKAMALADVKAGTPRVVKLYVNDARRVLIDTLAAAKRQGWEVSELLATLQPPKTKKQWGEAIASPQSPTR